MSIDFGIDAVLLTIGIFYVLYILTKGRCGPCNAEGMAPSMDPSPQFGSNSGSSQSTPQSASQQPLASHVSGTASNWSSGSSGGWFGGWRPWGGYHSGVLPSYYDDSLYDSLYDNPRAYYGIPYHTALAYNSSMYGGYGLPYRYDEVNAEDYEMVYDQNGKQRIIRKAMVVGG